MKRYPDGEVKDRAKSLYDKLIAHDSLINADRIIKSTAKLLKAEKKRRKQLGGK